jgi:hypothetical protein
MASFYQILIFACIHGIYNLYVRRAAVVTLSFESNGGPHLTHKRVHFASRNITTHRRHDNRLAARDDECENSQNGPYLLVIHAAYDRQQQGVLILSF